MTRSGAAAGTLGHFHEAALFDTDDEFVSIVAPFITEGVDNAEPVVVVCSDRNRLLLDAAVDPETFVFVAQHSRYTYPAATIVAYQQMLGELAGAGATHLRGRVLLDDVLDEGPADVEMVDPTPRRGRQVVGQMCKGSTLTPTQIADLTLAISETFANAVLYGVRPIRLLIWRELRGCVVRVCDGGHGPLDPFAGLRPVVNRDGVGGLGLWIAHQLCEVDILRMPDGTTMRLSLRN